MGTHKNDHNLPLYSRSVFARIGWSPRARYVSTVLALSARLCSFEVPAQYWLPVFLGCGHLVVALGFPRPSKELMLISMVICDDIMFKSMLLLLLLWWCAILADLPPKEFSELFWLTRGPDALINF